MAVVFISPRKKQKTFLTVIAGCLVIFLIFISLWVFLSKPKESEIKITFNKPKVSINLGILDQEQFKNLDAFEKMPLQFKYTAMTKKNKAVTGFISAVSKEEAIKTLEDAGYSVGDIEEANIGRENPFLPYSSSAVPATN